LLLLFLLASLVGGALASPRADLIGELWELLAGVLLKDLLRSTLRASVFLMILCAFSQWRGNHEISRGLAPALVSSNLLVEGLMLLLGLKLVWIIALDPLKLGVSVPGVNYVGARPSNCRRETFPARAGSCWHRIHHQTNRARILPTFPSQQSPSRGRCQQEL